MAEKRKILEVKHLKKILPSKKKENLKKATHVLRP